MASRSASAALATALTAKAYAAELGRLGRSVREERERQGLTLDAAVAPLVDMPQADLDWFRSKKSGPVRPDYWQGQLSRLERGTNSASLARTLLLLDLLGLRLELRWAEGPKPPRGPKQIQPVKTSRAAASARARAGELYRDLFDQLTVVMSEEFPGVTLRQVADEFSSPRVGINLNSVLTKTVRGLMDVTTAKHGILIKVAAVLGHRVVVVHAGAPDTRQTQAEEPVSGVADLTLEDFAEPTTPELARRASDRLASVAYAEAAGALAGRTLQGRRDFMSATLVFDDQARFVNGELVNAPPGKAEQRTVVSGARVDTNYGTVWLRQPSSPAAINSAEPLVSRLYREALGPAVDDQLQAISELVITLEAYAVAISPRRGKVKEQGVDPDDRDEVLRRTRDAAILVFTKPKTSLRTAATRLNDSMNVDGSTLIRLASEVAQPARKG